MASSNRLTDEMMAGDAATAQHLRWFAVLTLPQREARALRQLCNQGYDAWLPRRLWTVRHARRVEIKARPLFPRYLFVRFDPNCTKWRSINGTIGVAGLVSFGDAPTPVPQGIVEELFARSDANGVVRFGDRLQAGQEVRLGAGPFAETLGVLQRLEGEDAARVLLEIMGRQVVVTARRSHVLPAG